MRRTKIVATIGPASCDLETLTRMAEAGMDVARLNFSHGNREIRAGTPSSCAGRPPRRAARSRSSRTCPGPKLRIGALKDDIAELKPGEKLVLVGGSTEPGDGEGHVGHLEGARQRGRSRRRDLPRGRERSGCA